MNGLKMQNLIKKQVYYKIERFQNHLEAKKYIYNKIQIYSKINNRSKALLQKRKTIKTINMIDDLKLKQF